MSIIHGLVLIRQLIVVLFHAAVIRGLFLQGPDYDPLAGNQLM